MTAGHWIEYPDVQESFLSSHPESPGTDVNPSVEQGQLVAIQYDGFGDEIQRYTAPTSGTIISHNVETVRAAGSLLVRLIK